METKRELMEIFSDLARAFKLTFPFEQNRKNEIADQMDIVFKILSGQESKRNDLDYFHLI